MTNTLEIQWNKAKQWVLRDQHKRRVRVMSAKVERAFTDHPKEAGETYLEHLWFTLKMTARLGYGSLALLFHGIFPFLFTRTASAQVEKIWLIMRSRIPEERREEIIKNRHD